MKVNTALLVVLAFIIFSQCKSSSQPQESNDIANAIPIILLFKGDTSPTDLELLKAVQVESVKRISRSQNKWMIKIVGNQAEVDDIIENLKKDSRISEVSTEEQEAPNTSKNTKSGKSGPIKN